MALTLDYNYKDIDIYKAYLKISSITIKSIFLNNIKKYLVSIKYEVKATANSDYFCIENIEFDGDPDEPLYLQCYNYLKVLYPLAIDN